MTWQRDRAYLTSCDRCGDNLVPQHERLCWCSCGAVLVHNRDVWDETP